MTLTLASRPSAEAEPVEQRFDMGRVTWDAYLKISDALEDQPGLRLIYCDGRLCFVGKSRRHDWFAERLAELVKALARGLGIPWEDAGQATYRREKTDAGLEGDKTFYFGEHAVLMRGPVEIDLEAQPPPDLAIEVEVSHSADMSLVAWGRLGVAEVWRFQPKSSQFANCVLQGDGSYSRSERNVRFPALSSADVLEQLARANQLGADRWNEQLEAWVRDVIRPRLAGGF
jgi:Uma2 family endonuclease